MFKTPQKKIHPKTTYYITPLMQEIRLTSWYGKYPFIHRVSYLSGGDRRISSIKSISIGPRSPEHSNVHRDIDLFTNRLHLVIVAGEPASKSIFGTFGGVFFSMGKIHRGVF